LPPETLDMPRRTLPPLATRLRVYAYELVKTFGLFSVLPVLSIGQALRDETQPGWYTYSINITQYFALPLVAAVKLVLALALASGAAELWGTEAGAALGVIAYLALSGGMHLDGFADTMDALFAAGTKDPRTVMRDPRVGALGVVYLVFFLALYGLFAGIALNQWLAEPTPGLTAALLAAAISPRLFCHALVMASFGRGFENDRLTRVTPPYPWWRDGPGQVAVTFSWWGLILAILVFASGAPGAVLLLLALGGLGYLVIASYTLRRRVLPTLGFVNGDVLGFAICLAELTHWLLVALIFAAA
jgi:cobalamin synthase